MKTDITIIGAGIAGLTTACALAQKTHLTITVVDNKPLTTTWHADSYHHRVSAIALSSKRIFQNIQAWQHIATHRASDFNRISVWEHTSKTNVDFNASEIGEAQLGYIIENNLMEDALLKRLQQFPQVTLHASATPQALKLHDDHIALHINNTEIKSKLIIAADGANSWARQQAGIQLTTTDYGHHAIVATVRTTLSHEKTARQVFLENGPLAFLPLNDSHLSSIVWSMPPEQAQQILNLSDDEFKAELAQVFSHRLGEVTEVSKRFSFPLVKQRANTYLAPRVVLIGDAAHTVHPLAGQGLNVGLLDAASLVDVLSDALNQDRDISAHTTLRRYERWRKAENNLMLGGIDTIKSLFCSNKQSGKALRSFSLAVTNQLPLLKNLFTRHAVGVHDGLPTLAT